MIEIQKELYKRQRPADRIRILARQSNISAHHLDRINTSRKCTVEYIFRGCKTEQDIEARCAEIDDVVNRNRHMLEAVGLM